MAGKDFLSEYSEKYGKPDLERIGIFIEMPYMNGKGYVSPFPKPRPDKGRNIMCEGQKSKNGTQHGYFDKEFKRLFMGECLPGRGRKPSKPYGKNVSLRPMVPPGYPKKHATPGDYFGTFSGKIEQFSGKARPTRPYQKPKPNLLTSPGKKGGPGYAGICLSKYPEHTKDPYKAKLKVKEYGRQLGGPLLTVHYPQPYFDSNPFVDSKGKVGPTYLRPKEKAIQFRSPGYIVPVGPSKWQGGMHAGCFDKFPSHKKDMYIPKHVALRPRFFGEKKVFFPQSYSTKTMNTCSVLNRNVDLSVNVQNYKNYEPTYTKHLV